MSSRLARIGAGTLLSGALFLGGAAAPAFAVEGDDGDNTITQSNKSNNVQIAVNNKGDVNQSIDVDQSNKASIKDNDGDRKGKKGKRGKWGR